MYMPHVRKSYVDVYSTLMVILPMPCWGCRVKPHGMAVPSDAFTHIIPFLIHIFYLVMNIEKHHLKKYWAISVLYQFTTIGIDLKICIMSKALKSKMIRRCCIHNRAGQDQGGPRWDTLTKKSKSTKLLHIVLCYTQGVVAYDRVLFWGCIPPPLTPLQVKPEALILISIGGRTLQCGVVYMFYALVLPKLTFINNCGIGKSKGL